MWRVPVRALEALELGNELSAALVGLCRGLKGFLWFSRLERLLNKLRLSDFKGFCRFGVCGVGL